MRPSREPYSPERAVYSRALTTIANPNPAELAKLGLGPEERFSSEEIAREINGAALDDKLSGAQWNLYIHVPFCKSLCTFCNYSRLRVSEGGQVGKFSNSIASEAKRFGQAAAGRRITATFMGGGTPSILSARQLSDILSSVSGSFRFVARPQKTFEYDPLVMSEEKFEVLDRHGFNRYSFGIQSTDPQVNVRHNRGPQEIEDINRQFDWLRRRNAFANVDFLAGLAGTSPDQIGREIAEILAKQQPSQVCLYFISPTKAYVDGYFNGSFDNFSRHLSAFQTALPPILARVAKREGYGVAGDATHIITLTSDRRSLRDDEWEGVYADSPYQLTKKLNLIGMGDSARSRLFGRLWYRCVQDTGGKRDHSPYYLGVKVNEMDEAYSYLAMALGNSGSLERSMFRKIFERDVLEAFPEAIGKLRSLGGVTVSDRRLALSARSPRDRLRDILFFISKRRLKPILEKTKSSLPACG